MFIHKTVSLACILLVILLLCISSTNARIVEHANWACLCPTVRTLLSSTKESKKWWLHCNSATPTKCTVLRSMYDVSRMCFSVVAIFTELTPKYH